MWLQRTRRIPTAGPGREARAALQIIGMLCAMRCLLIGPKILEARVTIGRENSRFGIALRSNALAAFGFLSLERVGNSASMIQMTPIFIGLQGAVSHRRLQKSFLPIRGVRAKKGDTVVFSSFTDFCKAVGECVRVGSRSKPGS